MWLKQSIYFSHCIGGILGLFSGFSILSIFEIIYWIIQLLLNLLSGRKMSSSRKKNTKVAGLEDRAKQIPDEMKSQEKQIGPKSKIVKQKRIF